MIVTKEETLSVRTRHSMQVTRAGHVWRVFQSRRDNSPLEPYPLEAGRSLSNRLLKMPLIRIEVCDFKSYR